MASSFFSIEIYLMLPLEIYLIPPPPPNSIPSKNWQIFLLSYKPLNNGNLHAFLPLESKFSKSPYLTKQYGVNQIGLYISFITEEYIYVCVWGNVVFEIFSKFGLGLIISFVW